MKKFENLVFNPTMNGVEGVQARIQFDNGYGASIVKSPFSYGGNEGLYELAVLDSEGNITYDTPITNDVIGYLTEDEVTKVLIDIQCLNE